MAELNALIDGWDEQENRRRIRSHTQIVGECFALEQPPLAPLPTDRFEIGRVFTPRANSHAQIFSELRS